MYVVFTLLSGTQNWGLQSRANTHMYSLGRTLFGSLLLVFGFGGQCFAGLFVFGDRGTLVNFPVTSLSGSKLSLDNPGPPSGTRWLKLLFLPGQVTPGGACRARPSIPEATTGTGLRRKA